jgi:hypothetical protein
MRGGQSSSEDLLPLGYGERDRASVRVKLALATIILKCFLSSMGGGDMIPIPSPLMGEGKGEGENNNIIPSPLTGEG